MGVSFLRWPIFNCKSATRCYRSRRYRPAPAMQCEFNQSMQHNDWTWRKELSFDNHLLCVGKN